MGRLKNMSLKKSFLAIITMFLIVAITLSVLSYNLCSVAIEYFNLYATVHTDESTSDITTIPPNDSALIITGGEETKLQSAYHTYGVEPGYSILLLLQIIMPVVFVILALIFADVVFYRVKLKKPIIILRESAERIQRQDLNFEIIGDTPDELGELCSAFEIMRQTLLSNNQELWRQAEERKRLNAAFSHDLRNPVAVLKGAAKLIQKNLERGNISTDRIRESVDLVSQYTRRIENYIEVMTGAQNLEELECMRQNYECKNFQTELQNGLSILAEESGKKMKISHYGTITNVKLDKQFVFNTAENLISNALRYANHNVSVVIAYQQQQLTLCVSDDGNGFPPIMVQKGVTPFLRGDVEGSGHFGMGLYICKLLCEKHGGSLKIENIECGAKATAIFSFI